MEPLSIHEIDDLVHEWYHKLDVHAPVEDMLALLAEEGLEMRFPEGTLRDRNEFRPLYQGWIRSYFDEIHELKKLSVTPAGDTSEVRIVVNWRFRIWNPPAPKSRWLEYDVSQAWGVQRSPTAGRAVMTAYTVEAMEPRNGSPPFDEVLAQ